MDQYDKYMSTVTKQITAPLDDAYKSGASSINTSGFISFGNAGGVIRNAGIRFRSVPIPKGSTIVSAYIKLKANANLSGNNCNARIKAEDNSNPAQFSDYTDFAGRTLTTNYVDWSSIGAFTTGTEYTSPNIATVIQEIVDRDDWTKNKNLVLFINDNSSDTDARRAAYGFEDSTTDCAKLEITYTEAPSYTIRVSLAGYNALTDTNPDHFALYTDEDWILIKEYTRGTSTVNYNATGTITHNLGYIPFVSVWYQDELDTNQWNLVSGIGKNNVSIEITSTELKLINHSIWAVNLVYRYYIFYDNFS